MVRNCEKFFEKHIIIFQKRGDSGALHENMRRKVFLNNFEESKDVIEVTAFVEKLAPINARIIGSNMDGSNLRKLDLSNAIEKKKKKAVKLLEATNHGLKLDDLTLNYTLNLKSEIKQLFKWQIIIFRKI